VFSGSDGLAADVGPRRSRRAIVFDGLGRLRLLGGLVVKIGSRMIDSSLRTKLNNMKHAMKEVG